MGLLQIFTVCKASTLVKQINPCYTNFDFYRLLLIKNIQQPYYANEVTEWLWVFLCISI